MLLIGFLSIIQGFMSIHKTKKKMFVFFETIISEAHGVFYNKVCSAFISMGINHQVRAKAHPNHFTAFDIHLLFGQCIE